MPLFPWWERLFFSLLPGFCPICLGKPLPSRPWCQSCYHALPFNTGACQICGEPDRDKTGIISEETRVLDNSLTCDEGIICSQCQINPLLIHHTFAPLVYQREIVQLMCRYKQGNDLLAGRLIFELAWEALQTSIECQINDSCVDAVLPVPSDCIRTKQRGFDPVLLLAKRLAKLIDCPLIEGKRKTRESSQKLLNRKDRLGNMKDAFIIEHRLPQRVLLLDDVMTTGATLNSLATTCFEHGAEWVGAFALARTPAKR